MSWVSFFPGQARVNAVFLNPTIALTIAISKFPSRSADVVVRQEFEKRSKKTVEEYIAHLLSFRLLMGLGYEGHRAVCIHADGRHDLAVKVGIGG